jgi:hypothetical protein
MDMLAHVVMRMEPVIRADIKGEITFVFANRTGTEGDVSYTGTSAVIGIQEGVVSVYGILGQCEKKLLVVDTNKSPKSTLILESNSTASKAKDRHSSDDDNTSDLRTKIEATTMCTFPESEHRKPPISLVGPEPPKAYFAPENYTIKGEILPEVLKSSQQPRSPFKRPENPKSRNASQARSARRGRPLLFSNAELSTRLGLNPFPTSSQHCSRSQSVPPREVLDWS